MSEQVLTRWQRFSAPAMRIMLVALLVDLGVACLSLGIQFLAIDLHATNLVLGLLGALGSLAYTVGCLYSGGVSDRLGRKLPAVVGCTVAATVWLLMSLARSPYYLLALVPLSGLAMSFLWPPAQAWISELSGGGSRRLNRNLSLFNIAWTAGIMTGPLLAGYTYGVSRFLPFLLAVVPGYLAALVLARTPVADHGSGRPVHSHTTAPRAVVQMFLVLSWLGNFGSWFARGVLSNLFPKLATDLNFSHQVVGILIFLVGVGQIIAFILARFTDRWHHRLWLLIVAEVAGLAGIASPLWTQSPVWLGVGFVGLGIGAGITYVSSLTYALQGHAEERGQRSGLHEAVLGSGGLLGPLVGGLLAQKAGLMVPFTAGAWVFGAVVLIQVIYFIRQRRHIHAAMAKAESP